MSTSSASPPPPTPGTKASTAQLRILTLNVWGLKYISKLRFERIRQIALRLHSPSTPTYDFVCLQEIWYESVDWRQLQALLSSRYPHTKFFLSGAFGSGLAILSRWPILETRTHPYSLNGLPIHVQQGDWFVGKACGAITVHHPELGLVDVWNTHFVAAGGEDGPESRRAHRITQAYELATNARNSAKRNRHTIVCGDLNSTPPALCLRLLRDVGGLFDSWADSRPGADPFATELPPSATGSGARSGRTAIDPERALVDLGVTCDSPLNSWTAGKKLDARAQRGAGKRLDYILYRGPEVVEPSNDVHPSSVPAAASTLAYEASESTRGRLQCTASRVVFTEPSPALEGISLSDHFGVESILDILPPPPAASSSSAKHTHKHGVAPSSSDVAITTSRAKSIQTTLAAAMQALAGGHAGSRRTQRSHFGVFAAALGVAVTSVVASIFQPLSGVNPLLVLLGVVAGWAGTTMLYSAVVWFEWEKQMMELEMDQTRRLALLPSRTPSSSSIRPIGGGGGGGGGSGSGGGTG
ncbi:related to ISC1 - Inositol phosphoSphingolipid phospholipase [Pseudozyma flocculosa]|uniref:Related to ISC1 - Inositol phosphoSphingolipid phospholipase n=1 Tax=Pseudozyma flocculosa TaxID=84751 RepID=A0A5C3EYY8_9BASI|nr:related to ISC1 - Inositol phosphoSphingolipid phospholipase [Pseudozyma flocculosa]